MFISLEGPDGSGKSTQAALLVEALRRAGRAVVAVQEPGGTPLGLEIREILLRSDGRTIDPRAEAFLFSACRAQLVSEVIRPALARGADVVVDRFADSTLAYQGGGRGLPRCELLELIAIATQGLAPDLTLLLDVPAHLGLARCHYAAAVGGGELEPIHVGDPRLGVSWVEMPSTQQWTRFEEEALAFHEQVRRAYLDLAHDAPARWVVIDAARPVLDIAADLLSVVAGRINSATLATALISQ